MKNNFITIFELAKELDRSKHSIWIHVQKKKLGTKIGNQIFLNNKEATIIREKVNSKRKQYDSVSEANKK